VPHAIRHVGPIEVAAIVDADFAESPMVEAFPDVPPEALLAEKATYPSVYTDDDRWRLVVRGWLVRHPDGLTLVDTGIGGEGAPARVWTPIHGELVAELDALGVAPGHVDTVVITHVHDDHIGAVLTPTGSPRFPNARYLLQQADLGWLRAQAGEDEEQASVLAYLDPLADAGVLDLLDGDVELTSHLALHHLPGHTPGHQILTISSDGGRMLLSADTWNHPSQFAHPDWPSGIDADHARAAAARRATLADLLSHPGTVVATTHLGEPFGEVRSGRGGLAAWHPVD
jgi:glyoxylase-like metal-dependent hydrolase (beta-lactamase superfamily II)